MSILRVTGMDEEGGYVVQGTQDVLQARVAALRHRQWDQGYDTADDLFYAIRHVMRLRPRMGLYRWTPCHPSSCFDGGGHSGHLGYADDRGRGVFEGVYLQGW